jgi:phage internal scaffolding protein
MKIPFKTAYGERQRVLTDVGGPSRTKQSFADSTDINNIMAGYIHNGVIDHVNERQPQYANLIGASDFHTAQVQIRAAIESFEALPGSIRDRFDNDPHSFLEFVHDPDNLPEMRKMGLANPERPKKAPEAPPQPSEPLPVGDTGEADQSS